jgi:hypothetical protein
MRCSRRSSVVLALIVGSALGVAARRPVGMSAFAGQTSVADVEQTPASIVRLLVQRHAFVEIPLKGKVMRGLKMSDQTYAMPGGPSRVVLLKLPEYRGPYELTLSSNIIKHWGLKEGVFVPTTMILDADYVVTRTVPESELKSMPERWTKSRRLEATVPFTDLQKTERFLLVYTQATAVGQRIDRERRYGAILSSSDASAAVGDMLVHAERSADGTIEVETKPTKKTG